MYDEKELWNSRILDGNSLNNKNFNPGTKVDVIADDFIGSEFNVTVECYCYRNSDTIASLDLKL